MNTPLAKAITARPQTSGHRKVIKQLQNAGGIVYAKATVIYYPGSGYGFNLDMTYGRRKYGYLPESVREKVTFLAEGEYHLTLAYFAIPIRYYAVEGNEYSQQVVPYLNAITETVQDMNLQANLIKHGGKDPLVFESVDRMGPFIAIMHGHKIWLTNLVNELYKQVFSLMPNAIKIYKEEAKPHVSVAKLKRGKKFDLEVPLPQKDSDLSRFIFEKVDK